MMKNRWVVLCGFILLCLAVGGISGAITPRAIAEWYPTLNKPPFNPPNWVFGPVWTLLYVMMASAAWRAWQKGAKVNGALGWFYVQLALNFQWTFLFFGAHSIGLALVEIVLLWASIAVTGLKFWKLDKAAGWLMAPYLAWVSFATLLNASFWWLNS